MSLKSRFYSRLKNLKRDGNSMQKRMNSNSGFQLPQMNVSRVGRKVFLTGGN